jgi:hypothetical protein
MIAGEVKKAMFMRKILCVLLTAVLLTPLPSFTPEPAFAADTGAEILESGEIEAMAASGIAGLKASIDAEAAAVIGRLEAMAAEFERNLAAARQIMDSGGFPAPIDAPDPNARLIYTAQDLYDIRSNLSDSYVLMNDIDLSSFNGGEWVPIGDDYSPFAGSFDGQGHVIRNLKITGSSHQYAGLFGYVKNATIQNVGLSDTWIYLEIDYAYAGGICGDGQGSVFISNCYNTGSVSASGLGCMAAGICGSNSGSISSISNCYNTGSVSASGDGVGAGICGYNSGSISNCYNTGSVSASDYAGGICGSGYYSGSISNCHNTGDVSASAYASDYAFAGGICGSGSGSISNCHNTGDVSASAYASYSAFAGGICGSDSGSISNCHNTGDVSASAYDSAYAGGICGSGSDSDYDSISNCHNTGNVSASASNSAYAYASAYAGGICGSYSDSISNCHNTGDVSASAPDYDYAGGICGSDYDSISNCYNTGDVSASDYAGGICGSYSYPYSYSISNCYNTGIISADTESQAPAYAGGIVGYGDSEGTVSGCASLGAYIYTNGYLDGYPMHSFILGAGFYTGSDNIARDDIVGSPTITTVLVHTYDPATYVFYEQSTYTNIGWDFNSTWKIAPGGGLPVLAWQNVDKGPMLDGDSLRLLMIKKPSRAHYAVNDEKTIMASVANDVTSTPVDITIRPDASWGLYGDSACTAEITNKAMALAVGANTAYIKLTHPDFDSVVYRLVVTREVEPQPYRQGVIPYHSDLTGNPAEKTVLTEHSFDYLFASDATGYNQEIAKVAAALSAASYRPDSDDIEASHINSYQSKFDTIADYYIRYGLKNLDFTNYTPYYFYNSTTDARYGSDNVAFSFAKKILRTGETLVAVVIRGSDGSPMTTSDWISDFNCIANGVGKHTGFNRAMEKVYSKLVAYCSSMDKNNIKLLLTGHSRGGAVSNLLTVKLSDVNFTDNSNIYSYNFAVPDVEVAFPTVWGGHDNIHNICNAGDFFPYMPAAISALAGVIAKQTLIPLPLSVRALIEKGLSTPIGTQWGKFGHTYWFNSKNDGDDLFVGHLMDVYLKRVFNHASPGGETNPVSTFAGMFDFFLCPVDVEIYDASGNLVGLIKDDKIERIDGDNDVHDLFLYVNNGEKYVFYTGENQYTYRLTGTDNGTMSYLHAKVDSEGVQQYKLFQDVDLYEDKRMMTELFGDIDAPDVRLLVLDAQGESIAEIAEDGTETPLGDSPTPVPLESISLNKTVLTLAKGQTEKLTVSYNPANTTDDRTAAWQISGPAIATVDAQGLVTAVGAGTTTVAAIVGDKTASCFVNVTEATGDDQIVTDTTIDDLTAPVYGAAPDTTVASDQYTSIVSWNGNPTTFATNTIYTAIITLSAKAGYTLNGLTANAFTVTGSASANYSNGVITAVFPATSDSPASPTTYALSIGAGTGGFVSGSTSGNYTAGAAISVTAVANENYNFSGWTASGVTVGNTAAINFTMPANPVTLTANFTYSGGRNNNNSGSSSATSAKINVSTATFDKGGGKDIVVTLTPGSYTLSAVRKGNTTLVKGKDYTVSGNTVTLKKEYLDTLAADEHKFTFDMNGGTDPVLTVTVENGETPISDNPDTVAWQNPFADISETAWYYEDVAFTYKNGLFSGTGATAFSPDMPMTRGMLVTVLCRLAAPARSANTTDFTDISQGEWYSDAVAWTAENGIVDGIGNNLFAPDTDISRQDMAVILYRYMEYANMNLPVTEQYVIFADEADISDYAKNAIQVLNKLGIINGIGGNAIDPQGKATRAQVAAVFHRFVEAVQ